MQSRMEHLAREKQNIEFKVQNAAIAIQKTVKMKIQRKKYLSLRKEMAKQESNSK